MNNLSALDSPESCITHPVSGFSRFVAVLALLFLTISAAFAQPPLPSGDCGRNVLEFEAGYLSTIVNGLPISSQGSGTWEAWVKKDNWAAGQPEFTLFSNAYAYPNAKAFYVSLHPAVGLHFRSGYEGGGYAAYPTTMQYVTNSWHHFAATWSEDGSNVTIAIYVDGDSITSTVTTAKFGLESGFYFGGSPAHPTFAPGSMADIRLWDVAKTEAEISGSMGSTLIGNEAGLIGYWPLNDVTGSSTATNLVAGGSAATLVSMSPSSAWVTSHPFKIMSGAEVKSGATTDFGTQMTGLSSEARVFTIINDGTSALNFQGSPISQLMGTDADQFILDLTGTSGSLAAGATTTFSVSFSPTTEGVKTASISLTNVESCEDPYTINLSGIGSTLSGSISIDSHVSIYSGSDGQLTVSPTGGMEPYSYLWSNGATGSTVEGLSAGAYSVTIADNAGASVVRSATITQPDELIVTLEVNAHVSTVGGNDGAVTASVVGGVEPYSYLWNNDEATAAITDLVSGEYTVTVTDMNGAVASERITVTQPKAVSAYIQVVTEPGSNGNYGELSAYAHHGAPPYSYLWSTGATTQVISGLSTGTYSVTITDGYSMESVASVTFKSATIEYSGSFSEASANDGSVQGSLNVSLSGDMFSESDDILDENEVTVSGIPAGMNYDFEITERHAVGEVWDTLMGFSNSDGYWSDLTYGNERYVAVSSSYYEYGVMISYDGMRWQGVDNTYDSWKAITFGDSLFVAVSEYGYITRSSDGINWSETYLDDITFSDIVFGNGLFVAVASSYDYESIMVSPDGVTWEAPTDYSHNNWAAVSYGAGMFIAISGDGQPMTSPDGWEWSVEEATTIENVSNIAYGNGLFVVTTSSGEIWTSSDGSSWSQRMDVSDVLSAITYGQGEFMVVTDNDVDNLIYKSSNGIDWSTVALGSVGFNAIAYGKGRFIAMGDYHSSPGWIITSKLGSTATLSFAGNATAHQDADDISDIQIEFSDAAFANVEAADVINAVGSSGVGVDFNDNPHMVYSGVGFRATGAGNVEGRIVITLNGENFQDDDEDGLLDINDEVIISNIPGVLTPKLTITSQTQQGLDWTDGTDTSISGTYTAAAYGNGTYVALNYNSTDYIYSTDGANWVEAELNYDGWWDVTYANGLFVAVGSAGNGYVMTSTDGINWDYQEVYGYWEGVTYAEGRFVVVGDNAAMYSLDAQNWIVNSEVPSAEWYAVTYGNGKFVAVSPNSPNAMVSEDGASWLSVSSEIFEDGLEDITYGNGLFVGLGGYGDDVYTSVDGFIWTAHEIDYGNWNWITYGGGQFIIVGENYYDDAILRSVDGQSWSGTNNVIDIDLNVVLYAEGSFLAFTDQSDQWLLKSEPTASTAQLTLSGSGLNTSDNTDDITFEFADHAFANIAAAYVINATGPASSGLGLTFHPKTASITYAGEGFTEAVANDGSVEGSILITLTGDHFANDNEDNFLEVGTEVVVNNIPEGLTPALAITESSALGVTWTSTFPEGTAQYKSVAYGNGIYVAMADYGANKLITSNDGINWTPSEAQDAENWASVAFGNGIFVALPYYASHLAYTSEDGVNWIARAPSSEQGWIDITFGNGRFVAIRPNGTDRVMTSLDGIHWTLTTGDENVGDFVGFGNGLFVSGSYGDDIATSPDGINWTPQELSSSEGSYFGINDVAYGNGLFVLVGEYSEESSIENDYRVLTSADAVTWTPRSVDMSDWFAVDYGGGLFVAVAYNGPNRVMTSEDGINWTVQPDAPLSAWDDVIFGNDGFVAVANGGDQRVMTSFQTAEASLTLTGNAGAHQATHNVSDITFEFTDAAFTNSLAVNVLNATGPASSGLGVDFENNPPANDDCANAQELSVYEPGEGTATAGSTEFAEPNTESSPCTEESNIKDVWYSFNSGGSGQVIFTVEAGETTAIAGAVYTACGEIYQIESPFGDFPACALDQSELLLLTLSPNTDYLLQVWSPGGAVGDFTVLLEANAPPVIDPIADKTLDEETEIQFPVTATDDFLPLGNIEFALHGDLVNLGMSIDSESGEFSWIPSEDQGGVYEVVVYALDYLSEYTYSFSYSSDTFNITVNEVNVAPVLDAVEDQTATVGETLSFTISGSDNDLPSNVLTYSLDAISLEKGMSLNSATGEFNWLPTTTDAGTSNTVTVTLSDGSLTDERSFSINVEKLSQTVTFGELEDKVYGQSAFDLTATASSELTVTFTCSDETVASISGSTVTIIGAGTANITASQAGNDNYSAALDVSQSLTIEKATQTISFEALANRTYGDQAFELTATGGASGQTVTFTSSDETVASVSGSTVIIMGAGTATITASQAGNDNYSAALDVSQSLTIEKATQTISFEALANRTFGDQAFELTATGGASGQTVTFTSSDETVASVSGSTVTIMGAGTATITASQAGNDNYSAALDVSQRLTIEKATQTISFEALANRTYGDQAFELTATGGVSGQTVTFTGSDETVASVSGNTVTIMGAGTATITASQAGNDNYNAALDVSQSLTIEKATQTISFEALVNRTYGDQAFELTATGGASGQTVIFTSSDETVASVSGNTVAIMGAGTVTITASQAGNDNYSAALDVSQSLTIEKATQTISFEALANRTYGDQAFDLTATGGASGHAVTFTSSDETVASVSGNTVAIMGAGTVTITASQAGNDNYSAALDVSQSLTIEKATQTISFEALANRTYGDQAFELTATGGASGHTVTFTSSDETVASVSGSTVTIIGAGTATIIASQTGNDNYGVASDVSQRLIIGKASLMVSAGDASRVYGAVNPAFTIGYQGFIGDDSEADLEAVPSASTLATQTSDVGTYAITVSGGADQNYVFDYTHGILTINKALATITLTGLSQTEDGTAKSPTVTTDPAALNYSITFDGSSTLPTQAGTYAVEVAVLETNYEGSASGSFVLTKAVALGALPMVNEVKVYPNPATERLTVSGDDGLVVKIYDISGVLQLKHKTNQTIAVDSLPAGVYLIQVSDPNGRMVSHQRVVKY